MSALRLTGEWVAAASGGRVTAGDASTVVGRIETDSRRVTAGDFFIALRGPRFDGRAFAGEAIARGAMGVMVSGGPWTGAPTGGGVSPLVVEVTDTLDALQRVADVKRRIDELKVEAERVVDGGHNFARGDRAFRGVGADVVALADHAPAPPTPDCLSYVRTPCRACPP